MSQYVIIWKDDDTNRVSTIADDHRQPVIRNDDYVDRNGLSILTSEDSVQSVLSDASGQKFALPIELASSVLGWDV